MKRQHGQSAVEFALMAPIIFMMIFGMIYGGMMFMEYLHYSNAVRTAAREIAMKRTNDSINETIADRKAWLENFYRDEVSIKLYTPTVNITPYPVAKTDEAVVITVNFYMQDAEFNSLPGILRFIEFPPRNIKTLEYRMRLERQQ